VASPSQPGALPPPEALTDVLGRLADPAVTGIDKLPLVEGATAAQAADLDTFAKALQDNRMLPLTFAATDLVWSEDVPGNVTATVTMTPADASISAFSYPMEFKAVQLSEPSAGVGSEPDKSDPAIAGWQLSRKTADLLLAFGTPAPSNTAPAAPTPTP
jgi:hypothetical protein